MTRLVLGLVALLASVIAVGVTAAWAFADDDPTRRIAIYAAVVATLGSIATTVKNGHDVWEKILEKKKKADESAEKVIAKPLYDTFMIVEPTPGVELYNDGKIPVPIKRVAFCIKTEKGTRCWPLHMMGGLETVYDMNNNPGNRRQYLENARLEPGDPAVEFYMQFLPDRMKIKDLLEMTPDQISIRVESNKGAVAEVKGDEILTLIKRRLGLLKK